MPNRRTTRVAAAKQRTAAAVEARKSQSLRLRQQQQTKGNLTNKEKDDEEEDESAIKINANAPSSNKKQTIGGGRRPATTATITTEDSTNGNVNNNGRVNVNTRRSTSIGITNTPANFNSNLKQQEEAAVINKVNKVGCSAKNTLASNKTQQNKRNIKNYSKINSKKKEPEEEEEEEDFEEEEELQEAEQEINNSEDEEEDINLSAYEDANTDNSSSVVVINTIVKKSEVNREASESDDAGSSPGAGGSSEEEGPTSSECQSFYIIVNPDGSLVLDGTQQVQLVPGQERFPVSLPKKKVKSPTNPLPGAVPVVGQRARKSKPEGVTYGGSTDVGFISTPLPPISIPSAGVGIQLNEVELSEGRETGMSVGINPAPILQTSSTPGAPGPIDMDEFTNQLDPQSLATLETLIQSQQGREIIETLELDNHVATTNQQQQPVQLTDENNDSTADLQKPQKWDHSYTNNTSGKDSSASSVTGSNVGVLSPSSSVGGNSPRGSHNPGRSNRVGGSNRSLSASRLSEGDANIRRSQRQQDRIERQEAERILAENQQMLQREKEEIMKEANAQKAVAQSPVRIPETTIPQQIIPATPIAVPVPKAVSVPVTPPVVLTPVAAVRTGPPSMASSTRDSIDSSESDSRRPYPKRENRKLPAHLADPNYISLDDDGTKHLKDGGGALSEKGGGSRRSSTATKHEELLEESASIGNENSADDDDEDYTEDDPNRLWCICRQPHNNRFMICCDTCEEWFHGKCVNVTKAQGKAMELKNVLWNCPPCRKTLIEKAKKAAEVQKSTARAARRGSESTAPKSSPVVKLSKSAIAQQAEAAAAASASKMAVTPEKIAAQSTLLNKRGSIRRKDSIQPVESSESVQDCLVCGKPSRKDSIYCSDLCVQKYAENVGNKASGKLPPPATPTTPTTTGSPTKLKRTNSLKPEQKSDEPIFAFHVITPGASKSTEIVPPKPKELTASQLLKAQREQVAAPVVSSSSSSSKPSSTPPTQGSSPNPTVHGVSPNSVNAIISSTPTVVVKKMTTADGKTYAKLPGKISKETPLKMDASNSEDKYKESPTKGGRNTTSSQSEVKSKPANNRKSERESIKSSKEKERDKEDSASSEKLHRENMRKGLRELLKARLKEMTPEEQKRIGDRTNTPEVLAEKIEDELCRHYGGANHPKCKAKYRSIYFNLKDSKNCMYQEILQGNLKPKTLVKMEPHEMASAELAEWRKKETQKEIEAIKKSELDKIAESKKIQLLEKGVDDAVNVAEELRPHDISDIIDSTSHKSDKKETEKEKHSSSSAADKSKSSSSHSSSRRDRDKETEKERERSDRRRSDRHKSSSDKHKESSSSSSSRDKNRRSTRDKGKESPKVKHSSDNKHNKDKRHSKGKDSEKQKSSSSTDEQSKSPVVTDSSKKQPEEVETTTAAESHPFAEVAISTPPPAEIKKVVEAVVDVRHSTDSEQELPSSTIKTPDFTDESGLVKKDADSKHLFQTKIVMPELGGFNASAHSVSHASIEGIFFPESPVPIVGRISPETVWDYINKMKKTKEVIVFRLSPATPADSEGYMTFFSYFSSRGRLGVMGGIISPLKDVYLVPLDKHSPVNRSLLPFRGPGLPEERTHCLLCVVTRNIKGDIASSIPLKRKSVLSEAQAIGKKKVKFGPETEKVAASHTSRQRPSSSTTSSSKKLPPPLKKAKEDDDDDDAPYEPWEEDDDKVEVKEADAMPMALPPAAAEIVPDAVRQLQELEAQIAKEQQDIEKITGALAGRTNMSGIPGLDGEFAEGEEAEAQQAVAPFFRQESAPEEPTKVSQIEEAKEKVQISSTSKQSVIDVDDISSTSTSVEESSSTSEDAASSKKDNSPPETAVILEDSEEAYSPSAMQFSDEDSQGIEKEKEQVKEIPLEVVTKEKEAEEEEDEEQEPLPPGIEPMETVEKKQQQKPAVVVEKKTVEPVDDIKIVMKKPGFASTMASVNPEVSSSSPRKPSSSGTEMDVNDSFEPMIPLGNKLLKSTTETSKSETVFEKATGSVFGKPSASSASKMKININLITKQLPTENIQQQKSTEESQKAISLPTTTTVEPPPTQKQAIGVVSSPNINQSPIIPIHLPPPGLQQGPPPNLQATLPNVHQPPPSLQPPHLHNLNQPPPIIPVHIPPPNMNSAPTPPSSVVINLNVPPPPIMPMMSRPPMSQQSPSQAGGFHPLGPRPPGGGASFPNIRPPPPLNMRPGFAPTFGARPPGPGGANNMPPSHMPDTDREPMRGFDADGDVERVERINLDRERPDQRDSGFSGGRRENTRNMRGNMRGRDSRGRGRHGFGRRPFDRHSDRGTERVRRRRSKSEDRSRSRSPRDRRHRKRHSKSRSKSPLSRRWEARNRSRSRSIGKRNRHRSSKSPSPSGRRRRVSRSPRRNPRRGRSHSKSNSPPLPSRTRNESKDSSEINRKPENHEEDWESSFEELGENKNEPQSSSSNIIESNNIIPGKIV